MAAPLGRRRAGEAPKEGATTPSLGGVAERSERGGFLAVGAAVARLAGPIMGKRAGKGGAHSLARLKAHWTAIAGSEWGEVSWPLALSRDGVLRLRAAPFAALELQHLSPLLIERINLYFGCKAVSRIALRQGLLPFSPQAGRAAVRPLAEEEARALAQKLSGVRDSRLRAALARLGRAVRARED